MSDAILRGVGLPLVILALIFFGAALVRRWRRRHPLVLCPGPRRDWRRMISPLTWFWLRACRYDLTGLPVDGDDRVRCPECGRVVHPAHAIRTAYRWRLVRTGVVAMLAGLVVWTWPAWRNGRWESLVPTMALVFSERVTGPELAPTRMRRELNRRVSDGHVQGITAHALAATAVLDLRDDDVTGNATRAIQYLRQLDDAAIPALEDALQSPDLQQRQLAALVLRHMQNYEPSDRMLQVCAEGLTFRFNLFTWRGLYMSNMGYLTIHVRNARPWLADAMRSGDPMQQVRAATVVTRAGYEPLYGQAIPVLIEHLRDNNVRRDARRSWEGLHALGPDALPHLEPLVLSDDEQQRTYARRLIDRIRADIRREERADASLR